MKKNFFLFFIVTCLVKLSPAQNVGIGTTAPIEKLHVAGNVKADTVKSNVLKIITNAGAGKLLTSDAAGNGSWQDPSLNGNSSGAVGFGTWGDCSMNSIAAYEPVTDSAPAKTDYFGWSSAISGDWCIVGSYFGPNLTGAIDFFHFDGSHWVFAQRFTNNNDGYHSGLGISVSISGNFAIAGNFDSVGTNFGQGSANIYQYNGSSWIFKQKLVDPTGTAFDQFGGSVSLSGNYAVIGAYKDDVNANLDQGSACFFHYTGSNWAFMQKITDATGSANDNFGISVSVSDSLAVVSANADDVNGNIDQGSISTYKLTGNSWTLLRKISDSTQNAVQGDNFGTAVCISGPYMAVGVPHAIGGGKIQVYNYNGGKWNFMQDVTTDIYSNYFGEAVSISGNYILGGDRSRSRATTPPSANSFGAAAVFARAGIHWYPILSNITDPAGELQDQFGASVGIDGTTKRFVVGAPNYADQSGKVIFGKVN